MQIEFSEGKNIPSIDGLISPHILWTVFGVAIFVFLLFSIVLVYHWNKFGRKATAIATAEIVYFVVSVVLIFAAGATILLF